jgi:hypothetical protein
MNTHGNMRGMTHIPPKHAPLGLARLVGAVAGQVKCPLARFVGKMKRNPANP